jgi:hypothetical protein
MWLHLAKELFVGVIDVEHNATKNTPHGVYYIFKQ